MKGFPIDSSKHPYYGKTCVQCGKPMRVGDVVMVEEQSEHVFIDKELYWHRRHVEEALAEAPIESAEVAERVDKILASIAATGRGPVSNNLGGGDDDDDAG